MKFFRFRWPWKARKNKGKKWLDAEYEQWFNLQLDSLNRGEEVVPPWIIYPACDFLELGPMWEGWRQSTGEMWLLRIWFPYWKRLSHEKRKEYLKKWPPPTDLWELYLREKWK